MPAPAAVRGVLADLDDTLFDHAYATRVALDALQQVEPALRTWPLDELERRHSVVLERLHAEVLRGGLTVDAARIERFQTLLADAACERAESRALDIAPVYREAYQRGWRAVPGAIALLEALRAAGIPVVIVTNNGVAEQRTKMERCGMMPLVEALITSEEVGTPKPDVRIFRTALDRLGLEPGEVVMFGDAWPTDIVGAMGAGIRPVWLNRLGASQPDATVRAVTRLEPLETLLVALHGGPGL